IRSQLYEDEANFAIVTLDFDSDGPKIKNGFVTSKNFTLSELQENFSNASRNHFYLARYMYGDTLEKFSHPLIIDGLSEQPTRKIQIPEVIHPKILVVVDYNVYKRFDKETIIPYLFSFWSGVDMFFRQLQTPEYKLSIAGVLIAEDLQVLKFMIPTKKNNTSPMSINYSLALDAISSWLLSAKSVIPLSSYDLQMIMTPYTYAHERRNETGIFYDYTAGLSYMPSACNGINYNHPDGGITADPHNFQGVLRAAHELGHVKVPCDNDLPCEEQYLMAPEEVSWTKTKFSEASIEQFRNILESVKLIAKYNLFIFIFMLIINLNYRERDFSCMYNEPDIEKDKPFNMIVPSKERLVVSKYEFVADQVIKISYDNNTLIVTQVNTRKSSVAKKLDDSFLKIAVTDDNVIEVDPDKISQWSKVNIYHEDQFIYAYQGRKPVPENYNNALESNPKDLSPDYFKNDDTKMCFNKTDFDSDKLVKIYYENNKIHVSQRNVPDCESPNERKSSYLQYIGSELGIIYLYLTEINWDKKVCVQHDGNSIFVYQGEKPDLNRRENNSGKIKYLPDESYVNRKLPESEERKQRSEFNLTLDTEHTLSIFPNRFNRTKLVSISFENDKLIISQVGTSEDNTGGIMIFEDEDLMFMTSDVNKLLLHPMRLISRKQIHIRHEN
ncbi:GSCOCG00009065001-RA-CDS, partial [Cotesia congregata]